MVYIIMYKYNCFFEFGGKRLYKSDWQVYFLTCQSLCISYLIFKIGLTFNQYSSLKSYTCYDYQDIVKYVVNFG